MAKVPVSRYWFEPASLHAQIGTTLTFLKVTFLAKERGCAKYLNKSFDTEWTLKESKGVTSESRNYQGFFFTINQCGHLFRIIRKSKHN